MGTTASVIVIGAFVALLMCFLHLWAASRESRGTLSPWPHRLVGIIVALFGLLIVDTFVVNIPGPFDPGIVKLPAVSAPPPTPQPLDLKPIPAPPLGSSAREQHEKMLREWDAPKLVQPAPGSEPQPAAEPQPASAQVTP